MVTTHEQNSTQTNKLYGALCKAQAMLNPAEKESVAGTGSYKYKYANLAAIIGAAQDALAAHGLSFTTRLETTDRTTTFYARLAHESGEFLESSIAIGITLSDVKAIQELGKAITYLRRYTFSMMVGVITEEDDDAQSLVKPSAKPPYTTPKPDYISTEQKELLERELEDHPEIRDAITSKYGSLSSMPRQQFYASLERIREIKRKEEGQ